VTPEVRHWIRSLLKSDHETAAAVNAAVDELARIGPGLGRPLVDTIRSSRHHNMKELRPRSGQRVSVRVLFAFDPRRQCILLVAGNKAGNWTSWYQEAVPRADDTYDAWLKHLEQDTDGQP
jgi:hypothetical protein